MNTALSDHPSNPLQATSSDVTNNAYNRIYHHRPMIALSSEDELGVWSGQERYQQQVKAVVNPVRERVNRSSTPKPVDFDEDMSDDELAQPFEENVTPRQEFAFRSNMVEDPFLRFEEEKPDETQDLVEQQIEGDEDTFGLEEHVITDDPEEQEDQDELEDYPAEDDEMFVKNEPLTESLKYPPLSPFSSPQSSRPPSPDESKTLRSRSAEEQAEIQREMNALNKVVPELKGQYQLIDRLGTGTFSSVYKAIDLLYDDWDNQPWLGNHPAESTAYYQSAGPTYRGRGGRGPKRGSTNASGDVDIDMENNPYPPKDANVYVAIKRIHTTSGPDRIRNELSILEKCRGCRHSSQIITAFRHYDQVVVILPYQRHMDFREFHQTLHPEGIKCYFRCLFRALRDIHARGIIHRDVKPANFLYDPYTGIGTLCDFGLASRMESDGTVPELGKCLHSAADHAHPHGVYGIVNATQRGLIKTAQREARAKSNMLAEKVGYPDPDRRPVSKANRAGTRGFRAPEVLLKCQAQTGAIDVWSAGIIFLCFLTGKFPIFQSNDDIEALMEIACVVGMKKTERAATLHGRTLATNVPDLQQEGIAWQEFVEKLNPDIMTPRKYDMRYYPHNCKHRDGNKSMPPPPAPPTSSSPPPTSDLPSDPIPAADSPTSATSDRYLNPPSLERHTRDMRHAFDLLEAMLHFESTKRVTPREGLYHPYLSEPGVDPETEGDDEFVPHPPGEGVCRKLHRVDRTVEEMYVEVWRTPEEVMDLDSMEGMDLDLDLDEEKKKVVIIEEHGRRWVQDVVFCIPGQGIAIGNRPCEFHRDARYIFD